MKNTEESYDSYETSNSIKKEMIKKQKGKGKGKGADGGPKCGTKRGKGKGKTPKGSNKSAGKMGTKKGKRKVAVKKTLRFSDDMPEKCIYCSKTFDSPNELKSHHKKVVKCGLQSKLDKYKTNFNKLKTACMAIIQQKDAEIAQLKNDLRSHEESSVLGINAALQERIKKKLTDFYFPYAPIDEVLMHSLKKINTDKDEAFVNYFKHFLENKKGPKDKNPLRQGIFITNDKKECGLVIKCNNKLFIDTLGTLMELIKVNYFYPQWE